MAGCSSPFVGPHPKHTNDYTQTRGPQTDTIQQNIGRRLALAPPDNPRPYRCRLELTEDGAPTEESLARCARAGRPARREAARFKPPPGGREPGAEAGRLEPLSAPEYITVHMDQFAGVGANADRFSQLQPRPAVLETIELYVANADSSSSHAQLTIRYGDDQTAGLQSNDVDLFIYPDQVVGSILSAGAGTGHYLSTVNIPLLNLPFLFHGRAINAAGATPLHITWVLTLRVIRPSDLRLYTPPHLTEAAQLATIVHAPRPPSRTRVRYAGTQGSDPASNYGKIELLAQQLRENPFGIPHAQMLAKAQEAGFRDAERAVGLAIRQAAKPPDMRFLASQLE